MLPVKTRIFVSKISAAKTKVYHHWGFASIYRPLSYPFRSLGVYLDNLPNKNYNETKVWKKSLQLVYIGRI